MLTIHAICVSVDYAPLLERAMGRWLDGLASLVVVSAPRDEATSELTRRAGAQLHLTNAFWEDGAYFNKARSIEEARSLLPAADWHLFVDADVIPPAGWHRELEVLNPTAGMLHGARRVREDSRAIDDRELAGFFQLFHSSDPRAAAPLDRDWLHAGNYDSTFMQRWPRELQRILALELVHQGETGVNWCGKGNEKAMAEIRRRRRSRSWRTETVRRRA